MDRGVSQEGIFRLHDKNLFKKVIKTLAQDDDIARHYKTMKHYIDAVVIYDADTVEGDIKDYDPKKKNLKNANNIGIFIDIWKQNSTQNIALLRKPLR